MVCCYLNGGVYCEAQPLWSRNESSVKTLSSCQESASNSCPLFSSTIIFQHLYTPLKIIIEIGISFDNLKSDFSFGNVIGKKKQLEIEDRGSIGGLYLRRIFEWEIDVEEFL